MRGEFRFIEILHLAVVLLGERLRVAPEQEGVDLSFRRDDEPRIVRQKLDAVVVILRIDGAGRLARFLEAGERLQRRPRALT